MNKYLEAFRQIFSSTGENYIFFFSCCIVFLGALISKTFVSDWLISFVHKLFSKTKYNIDRSDLLPAKKPVEILFVSTITMVGIYWLGSYQVPNNSAHIVLLALALRIYKAAMIVAVSILIYSLVPAFMHIYQKINRSNTSGTINPVVSIFIERILRLLIVAICIISILSELGINVNGLITGIGLGGLTFALAAQDTASNIFGGMVIVSDKPFSVGDWIQCSELEGVVEDITFRSTRIRTFDDALIVVPNNKLTSSAIINWTKMKKRRIRFHIGLTYQSSPESIQSTLDEIRYFLKNHEEIDSDSVLVRLDEFAPSSLSVLIALYVKVTPLQELKRIQEEINFQILDIVYKCGANFAYPSTTVYLDRQ